MNDQMSNFLMTTSFRENVFIIQQQQTSKGCFLSYSFLRIQDLGQIPSHKAILCRPKQYVTIAVNMVNNVKHMAWKKTAFHSKLEFHQEFERSIYFSVACLHSNHSNDRMKLSSCCIKINFFKKPILRGSRWRPAGQQ